MNAEAVLSSRRLGWIAIASVVAFPVVEALRILLTQPHLTLYGDQALIELGARSASQFDALTGPYSREGFHHLGPVIFYLLAPFVRIFGSGGAGLYFGAVLINAAALAATIAFLWRRFGVLVALWSAFVINLFCFCVGTGTLREPWNPYLIIAPTVLFIVLWSACFTETKGAGIWTAVAGSYLIQTEVATTIYVGAMWLIVIGNSSIRAWRNRDVEFGAEMSTRSQVVGAAAFVAMWIPPVVELLQDKPNNLQLINDYFSTPHTYASLNQAITVATRAAVIMPFGNADYVLTLQRTNGTVAIGIILIIAAFAYAVFSGLGRRQTMSVALAASGALGLIVGIFSFTLAIPPIDAYLTVWLAFIPLSFLLSLGVALFSPSDKPVTEQAPSQSIRPLLTAGAVLAIASALLTVQSDARLGSIANTTGSGPWPANNALTRQGRKQTVENTRVLSDAAIKALTSNDERVNLNINSPDLWPYAAGVVLALDEHGVQSTVSPSSWTLYFGNEHAPGSSPNHPPGPATSATYDLYAVGQAGKGADRGKTISQIDGIVLTIRR